MRGGISGRGSSGVTSGRSSGGLSGRSKTPLLPLPKAKPAAPPPAISSAAPGSARMDVSRIEQNLSPRDSQKGSTAPSAAFSRVIGFAGKPKEAECRFRFAVLGACFGFLALPILEYRYYQHRFRECRQGMPRIEKASAQASKRGRYDKIGFQLRCRLLHCSKRDRPRLLPACTGVTVATVRHPLREVRGQCLQDTLHRAHDLAKGDFPDESPGMYWRNKSVLLQYPCWIIADNCLETLWTLLRRTLAY